MNDELRSNNFAHLFKKPHVTYGTEKDQAALFEDVIHWPNPDTDDIFYQPSYKYTGIEDTFDYYVNKLKMREPKFEKGSEMLAVGCSHSFGVGLPLNLIWPEIVSKNLNFKYSNISKTGTSAMYQIINIFHYCQAFGNPKIILCMFPNFERTRIFIDNKTTESGRKGQKDPQPIDLHTNFLKARPNFLKLPADPNTLISEEQAFYNNALFIFMLEQYCRSNSIKLIWSTWGSHSGFEAMFKQTYQYYEKSSFDLSQPNVLGCYNHEDLRSLYPKIFEIAADAYKGPGYGHGGVHWHQHVAEFFIDKIKKDLS